MLINNFMLIEYTNMKLETRLLRYKPCIKSHVLSLHLYWLDPSFVKTANGAR